MTCTWFLSSATVFWSEPCLQPYPGTEGNRSSFSELEFHTGTWLGQKASISLLWDNLQAIQKKLKILSAEGLLPTIKAILGWLNTNYSLLSSFWQSSFSLWSHLVCAAEPAALRGRPLANQACPSHHFHDQLQRWKAHMHTGACSYLRTCPALAFSTTGLRRGGLRAGPTSIQPQDEAALCICFLRSFGHFVTGLPGQFEAQL
jgi:hypothetical protein